LDKEKIKSSLIGAQYGRIKLSEKEDRKLYFKIIEMMDGIGEHHSE
jgi:hypothetical protein